jgi:hypothetical protein
MPGINAIGGIYSQLQRYNNPKDKLYPNFFVAY